MASKPHRAPQERRCNLVVAAVPDMTYCMPPVGTEHVVPVHAVARMLDWSTARVRSIDDILKPTRTFFGSRLYDVDRVLFLVHTMDVMHSLPPLRVVRISKKSPRREGDLNRYGRWFRVTRKP